MTARPILARLALLLALAAAPAAAQSPADVVVAQLRDQGYLRFEVTRTLLGRVQVIAEGPLGRREIVFNPATGEILRDLLRPARSAGQGADRGAPAVLDRGGAGGAQGGGADDRPEDGDPQDRGGGGGGGGGGDRDNGLGNDADRDDEGNPGRGRGEGRGGGRPG